MFFRDSSRSVMAFMDLTDLQRLLPKRWASHDATASALSRLISGLDALAHGTEDDFLDLGADLQRIQAESSALHRRVTENIQVFKPENENEDGILNKIEQVIEANYVRTRRFLVEVEKKRSALQAINNHVDPIAAGSETLRKTGMYLRALGVNTAIEISRSKQMLADFSMVSEDTMTLAEGMRKISDSLTQKVQSISAVLQSTLASTEERMRSLAELVDRAASTAEDAFDKCADLVDRALQAMEQASALSREVSEKIGTIVMGIQFHDASRQRLEHIIEALTEMAPMLQAAQEPNVAADQRQRQFAEAFVIVQVQKSQLQQLISEAEELYENQRQAFAQIADAIEHYTDCLQTISIGDEGEKNVLSDLVSAVTAIDSIQEKGHGLAEEIKKTAAEADGVIVSLATFIKDALELSGKVHVNALNSIIHANKFGELGKPLEVLSQDMATVARQVEEVVPVFSSQVSEITSLAQQGAEEFNAAQATEDEQQVFTVSEMVTVFDAFRENTTRLLADGHDLGQAVATERENLQFLQQLVESLLGWHGELGSLAEVLEPMAGDVTEAHQRFSSEEYAKRYTMSREREIHQESVALQGRPSPETEAEEGFSSSQAADADPFAEVLFTDDYDAEAAEDPRPEDDTTQNPAAAREVLTKDQEKGQTKEVGKFGDNVELF